MGRLFLVSLSRKLFIIHIQVCNSVFTHLESWVVLCIRKSAQNCVVSLSVPFQLFQGCGVHSALQWSNYRGFTVLAIPFFNYSYMEHPCTATLPFRRKGSSVALLLSLSNTLSTTQNRETRIFPIMSFKIAIVAFVLLNSHGQDLVLGKQSQPGSDHVNQVSPFVGLADYMKRAELFLFKFVHGNVLSLHQSLLKV